MHQKYITGITNPDDLERPVEVDAIYRAIEVLYLVRKRCWRVMRISRGDEPDIDKAYGEGRRDAVLLLAEEIKRLKRSADAMDLKHLRDLRATLITNKMPDREV